MVIAAIILQSFYSLRKVPLNLTIHGVEMESEGGLGRPHWPWESRSMF